MKAKWPLFFICIMALSLVAIQITMTAAPAAAQENEITAIRPGGVYTVIVQVHKPSFIALPESIGPDGWEVRTYFYVGTNCYNTGSWVPFPGEEQIYSGWWAFRIRPGAWAATPEDKTLIIPNVHVVDIPRPSVDIQNGMGNIPAFGSISLRTRWLVRNIKYKIYADYVTFTVGGIQYRYPYNVDSYGDLWIKNPDGQEIGKIDVESVYFVVDQTTAIDVRSDAPATGTIVMPSPIDIALSTERVEPTSTSVEIPLVVSLVIFILFAAVIVVTIVYLVTRKKEPSEEEFTF